MKIKVREIPSSGLVLDELLAPGDIGLGEDFINEEAALAVKGRLDRAGDFVLARLEVTYGLLNHCARCLEAISREETRSLEMDFEAGPGVEYIDLGERLREEIIIGYTPRALCKEDCRGICSVCGADLNTESCECEK
jgi:uncharacterized protein